MVDPSPPFALAATSGSTSTAAKRASTLVFAWGNPGRGDDALGPRFVEIVESWAIADVDCLSDFQLQVEHALDLQHRTRVLFVDASAGEHTPFSIAPVSPARDRSLASHAMSPAALLQVLCDLDCSAPPQAWLLGIRGHHWEFGAPLSASAERHLAAALDWARQWLSRPPGAPADGPPVGLEPSLRSAQPSREQPVAPAAANSRQPSA